MKRTVLVFMDKLNLLREYLQIETEINKSHASLAVEIGAGNVISCIAERNELVNFKGDLGPSPANEIECAEWYRAVLRMLPAYTFGTNDAVEYDLSRHRLFLIRQGRVNATIEEIANDLFSFGNSMRVICSTLKKQVHDRPGELSRRLLDQGFAMPSLIRV